MTDDTRVLQALHVLRFDDQAKRRNFSEILHDLERASEDDRLIVVCDETGWPIGFVIWISNSDGSQLDDIELTWVSSVPGRLMTLLRVVTRIHFSNLGVFEYRRTSSRGEFRTFRWNPANESTQVSTSRGDSSEEILTSVWGRSRTFGYFDAVERSLEERIRHAQGLMLERLQPHASGRYLDIGSRHGALTTQLSEQWRCEVVGLERITGLVNVASDEAKSSPLVRFVQCDLTCIPEDLGLFDGAISTDLSRKSKNPEAVLVEARLRLRKSSRFVLADRVGAMTGPPEPGGELRDPPPKETWERMFSRCGFEVVGSEDWTSHATATLDHVHRRIRDACGDGEGKSHALSIVRSAHDAMAAGNHGWHLWTLEANGLPDGDARRASRKAESQVTLVMLSGGIDSVYALWDTLARTDHVVLAHHIHFRNAQERSVPEARACREIVKWLRRNCRQFDYRESTADRHELSFFGYDMIAVGFEAGLAAHSFRLTHNRKVDHWRVGSCLDEPGWHARWPHVLACCEATSFPHSPPAYADVPVISKEEQLREMPRELALLTWGCRNPVWRESMPFPCGRCHACGRRKRLGLV